MGMAASQARHIELCARKTNVEYEGQQINQQRTALANESAGLFNSMLQLQVPTAPNYNAYQKTIYTFSDGTNDYTIDKIAKGSDNPEYNCKVTYYTTEQEYTGMYKERSDLKINFIGNNYGIDPNTGEVLGGSWYYGTKKLEAYDPDVDEAAVKQIYLDTIENKKDKTMNDSLVGYAYKVWADAGCPPDDYDDEGKMVNNNRMLLNDVYKYSSGGVTYYVSLDNAGQNYYDTFKKNDDGTTTLTRHVMIDGDEYPLSSWKRKTIDDDDTYVTYDSTYYNTGAGLPVQNCYATTISEKKYQESVNAYMKKEDTGNYSTIKLENYSNTFDLTVYQETDEQAYNQAMNNYNYQKMVYDKAIADINAKTEIIQQEDRTLELKLKQLDTEHTALQTEIDAVKKVCNKNIEDTFKTFNG